MVTGVRAFGGDNALSTLSAILRDEAKPLAEVAPDTPPQIEQVIKRCLRKNPDERWQSMQDVKAALTALKHESDSGQLYKPRIPAKSGASKSNSNAVIAAVVGGVVLLGAAGGGLWYMKRHRAAQNVSVNVSPDGSVAVSTAPPPQAAPAPAPENPPPAAAPAEPVETVLTNDNIIELVEAKVAPRVIIDQIRASKTNFNLSSPELIRLTKAGVSATIIEVMRNPKAAPPERTTTPKSTPTTQTKAPTPAPVTPVQTAPPPTAAPAPVTVAPTPAPTPAPVQRTLEKITVVTVPDGAPIAVRLAADVPSDVQEGQNLRFTVVQDFKASDSVVIAKGAVVTGAVVEVGGKKKFLGIGGGKATFRLTQVDAVDGHKLNIRATAGKGQGGPAQRPLEPVGKKPPKDLIAAAGTDYIGYVDGEQTVSLKK